MVMREADEKGPPSSRTVLPLVAGWEAQSMAGGGAAAAGDPYPTVQQIAPVNIRRTTISAVSNPHLFFLSNGSILLMAIYEDEDAPLLGAEESRYQASSPLLD